MRSEDLVFTAGEHRLAATRLLADGETTASVLTLHGLGKATTRHTIRYVVDHLAANGYGSVRFDFSGGGESTGVLTECTLRSRREEALVAAGLLDSQRAPVLIGTSMGAHLAAWIAPVLRPRALVMFCPAAYPARGTDLPFDEGFTRPGRHPDSPAYAGLAGFDGELLIIAARRDKVVPAEVIDGYLDAAAEARSRRVIWLDCDHFVHRWLPGEDACREDVLQAILHVVSTDDRVDA